MPDMKLGIEKRRTFGESTSQSQSSCEELLPVGDVHFCGGSEKLSGGLV